MRRALALMMALLAGVAVARGEVAEVRLSKQETSRHGQRVNAYMVPE